jgi:tripartite-type tricarboxylate transporter receptor subunit TctC
MNKTFQRARRACLSTVASAAVAVVAAMSVTTGASAQTWPERPVTLIVPFAPGASSDGLARILATELSTSLGKPVVVENKPGGGGATGLILVSKAAPDGYTIGMGATGALVINPHVPDLPPLDPLKQLAPLAKIADIPLVLVASKRSGFNTVKQAIDGAAQKDDAVAFGSTGNNTAQHLSGELFSQQAKVKMVHVPYRGSAPAVTDLLAGSTPIAFVDLTSAYQHVKAGTLTAIGVTSPARSVAAPEIPTIAEGGLPGYAATAWMGILAPVGVPPAVMSRLDKEIQTILARPDIRTRVLALGAEPAYLDSAAFGKFISAESQKWKGLVASATPAQPK